MKKITLALFLSAAGSSVAFGSSTVYITFNTLPAEQGNGTTNSQSNVYVGEVGSTVAGIPSQNLVCDDFDQSTTVPSGAIDFSVNTISSLTTSPLDVDFSQGTLPNSTTISQIQAYDTAAVLLNNLESLTANSGNAQAIADYQFAIWDLMEPGAVDGNNSSIKDSPLDANATADLNTAYSTVQTNSTATQNLEKTLVIYTPTSGYSSNQEFLGLSTPVATPEPSSWFLMASLGLLLLVPQVRSRLQRCL